ncbi:hypothetical protein ACMSW3_000351 [Acinetobacter baumannii]|uniref:Uncharacterized protein n=3 Tax=Acinetobacter calcoaceticus/baumannii complex TaxID=909768 RepID=A0AAP1FBG9_ACIBA|nr:MULTISPECIES: hypothetical protein [Acinetobacter]ANC35847.1 hypothetical protein Aba3207_04095 [Acinetobacter baumannii]AVE55839.1 hypothetical protein AM442_15140 [Acinetobacter baumannii]AVO92943.1 hypothetical protein AM480_19795 [Acinetobacter baumannii]AXX39688.1 hypothetical protein Aba9201_01000 [Acinetobacter baumannii]EHU1258296.1 hypothetical protein [Acinetobacter baumannii]
MTDLNKEREVNLRFEQDDGFVWVFDGDSQFGTEISHLMMMHADEYNEDELRVTCHHAACEIDRLRAELEKAKAQAVPEGYVLMPLEPTQEMLGAANLAPMPMVHIDSISGREKLRISTQYKAMVNVCKSGAEG